MKNRHINLINLIFAFILVAGVGFIIWAVKAHDSHKDQLLSRSETLSTSVRSLTQNYDKLLSTDYQSKLTKFTLDQGRNLEEIRATLKLVEGQQAAVKKYRETLTKAIVNAVVKLKLPGFEKNNEIEALEKNLASSERAQTTLEELQKKFASLKKRDDDMAKCIVDLGKSMRLELKIEDLKSFDQKYEETFKKIMDKMPILEQRRAKYEQALVDIANAAGVPIPRFEGEDVNVTEQVANLTKAIEAKQVELETRKREKSTKENELKELLEMIAEQEQSLKDETEKERLATAKRAELGSHVWTEYNGQEINLISPEAYDRCYQLFKPAVNMLDFDIGLVQIDAGLANVVQFSIGDKGRTQKVKAPILPEYDLEYCRISPDGKVQILAILKATQVAEYSTVARITKILTQTLSPMQKGDYVRYSPKTISQILADRSAQPATSEETQF